MCRQGGPLVVEMRVQCSQRMYIKMASAGWSLMLWILRGCKRYGRGGYIEWIQLP